MREDLEMVGESGVWKPQMPKYQFGSDTMLTLETKHKKTENNLCIEYSK